MSPDSAPFQPPEEALTGFAGGRPAQHLSAGMGTSWRAGDVVPYIIVPDVDAPCEKAQAAGAEVLIGPKDEDYGGRVFTCRDPEGQVWSFGSYDPWAAQ